VISGVSGWGVGVAVVIDAAAKTVKAKPMR
jgi:hypothetical protein